MIHFRMITVLLLLTGIAGAAPVEEWNRTFDLGGVDLAKSVQQTSDGGYIIAGYNYGSDSEGAFLIKTDADGNQQWSRIFEGYANSVEQTVDGGYILLGGTYIGGIGLDIWLIKTDSAGNEVWKTTFKGNDVSARSVMQTSDQGYIIAGSFSPFSISSIIFGPNYDALLIKTDARGNEEWKKTYGGRGRDYASSVQQTEDGGYIIAGLTGEKFKGGDTVVANAWLIKTDIDGNKVWEKTFGGDGFDQFSSVQQTGDGGYILAGSTTSYGAGTLDIPFPVSDAWLVKVSGEPEGTAMPKKIPAFEALLFFITLAAVYVRGLWRGK